MKKLTRCFIAKALITSLLPAFPFNPKGAVPPPTPDTALLEYAVRVARSYENPSSLLGEIAVRYAEVGQFERALELANSIENDAERDVAKAKVATSLKKSGHTAKATELLDSVQLFIESGGAKTARHNTYILGEIAAEFAACGAFERVFELALITDDDYVIRRSLEAVVDNLETTGNNINLLSKVIRESARLQDGEGELVISKVAEKYAEAGQYQKAIGLANSLAEEGEGFGNFNRDDSIQAISVLLGKRGEFRRAIKLAESTDDYFKTEALIQIAREQIGKGRNDEAVALLERVTSPLLQEPYEQIDFDDAGIGSRRLASAAVAYASAGYRVKAKKLLAIALERAKRVRKLTERDDALHIVAASYAEAGMFEQAADAAQPTNFTYCKIKPLTDVAVVMLRHKRHNEVAEIVQMIQNFSVTERPESKADGLVEIAGEYLALRDNKSAGEISSAAFELARNCPVNDFQPITMLNVAVMLARACEYSKAIEAAANIQSPFYKALALADIGVLQARDGWTLDEHALAILDSMTAGVASSRVHQP